MTTSTYNKMWYIQKGTATSQPVGRARSSAIS